MKQTPKQAIAILFLVDGIGFGVWAAHIPVIQKTLRLDTAALSFVLLSLVGGSILSMPLTGYFITRFGSRITVRSAAGLYILALAHLALLSSHWAFLIGAALFGAAKGALDVAVNAQALAVEKHDKASCLGFCQGCWSAGGLLGAGFSSLMLHYGSTAPIDLLLCASALSLLSVPAFIGGLVDDPLTSERESSVAWGDAYLLKLAVLAFSGLFAEGVVGDWAAVYLHLDIGTTVSWAAAGYACYAVAMAASRFAGDWVSSHFTEAKLLVGSGSLIAAGFALLLMARTWLPAFAGLGITGIGMANIVPVVIRASGRSSRSSAGAAISAVSTVGYFGLLAGPPLIGWVAHWTTLRSSLVLVILAGLVVMMGAKFTGSSKEI
jgi:MFS family permease